MTATPDTGWLDRSFLDEAARIDRYGYINLPVDYGGCSYPGCTCGSASGPYPWTYTVGFHRIGQPELVMMGLPVIHVNCVSAAVYEAALFDDPMTIGPNARHRIHHKLTIALMPVPNKWLERDRTRMAAWFNHFGDDARPQVLQAVWADAAGRMPWEHDVPSPEFRQQPVLLEDPISFPTPPRNRPVGRTAKRRRR